MFITFTLPSGYASTDAGPFNISGLTDTSTVVLLASGITKSQLLSGHTVDTSPYTIVSGTVASVGACTNEVTFELTAPTPTPTITPTVTTSQTVTPTYSQTVTPTLTPTYSQTVTPTIESVITPTPTLTITPDSVPDGEVTFYYQGVVCDDVLTNWETKTLEEVKCDWEYIITHPNWNFAGESDYYYSSAGINPGTQLYGPGPTFFTSTETKNVVYAPNGDNTYPIYVVEIVGGVITSVNDFATLPVCGTYECPTPTPTITPTTSQTVTPTISQTVTPTVTSTPTLTPTLTPTSEDNEFGIYVSIDSAYAAIDGTVWYAVGQSFDPTQPSPLGYTWTQLGGLNNIPQCSDDVLFGSVQLNVGDTLYVQVRDDSTTLIYNSYLGILPFDDPCVSTPTPPYYTTNFYYGGGTPVDLKVKIKSPTDTALAPGTPTPTPTITVTPTYSQTVTPTYSQTVTPTPTITPTSSIQFLEGSDCYDNKMSIHPSSSTVCTNIQGGVGLVNYYMSNCDYQTVFVNGNPSGCQVYINDGVTLVGSGFLSDGCRFWEIVDGTVVSTSAQNCGGADECCVITPEGIGTVGYLANEFSCEYDPDTGVALQCSLIASSVEVQFPTSHTPSFNRYYAPNPGSCSGTVYFITGNSTNNTGPIIAGTTPHLTCTDACQEECQL